jgi:lysophospholipase L1-like esterase
MSRLLRNVIAKPRLPPLPIYQSALKAMRAGTRNARIMCAGNSYTQGDFSDAANVDYYTPAFSNQLAIKLSAGGVLASCNSTCGFQFAVHNAGSLQNNNDPRVVMSGIAKALVTQLCIGGPLIQMPNATSGVSFTPANPVDTFRLYYITTGGANTFNVNINGGSNTLIDASAAVGYASATFTGTLGTNTLNVNWVSGFANICGWEAWDSTKTRVNIMNCGWSGSTSGNWATFANAHSAGFSFATVAPDLTILELGINDFNTSVSLATYMANMQTLITTIKNAGSDCILLTGAPWDAVNSGIPYATQTTFWSGMQQLATQNNLRMINIYNRWGDFSAATTAGLYATGSFSNSSHPSAKGQLDYAQAIFNAINMM